MPPIEGNKRLPSQSDRRILHLDATTVLHGKSTNHQTSDLELLPGVVAGVHLLGDLADSASFSSDG
jgi:hypothetical protein